MVRQVEEVMAERYIIIVVVPLLISAQPLLSVMVAFTFTAVVALAVRTMLVALFKLTALTTGAAFETTTVVEAVGADPAAAKTVPSSGGNKVWRNINPPDKIMSVGSPIPRYFENRKLISPLTLYQTVP